MEQTLLESTYDGIKCTIVYNPIWDGPLEAYEKSKNWQVIKPKREIKTNMKDTMEKIQALLTEQLQTPDPLTYKEFYKELMELRRELKNTKNNI